MRAVRTTSPLFCCRPVNHGGLIDAYRDVLPNNFVLRNTVAPRFQAVDPDTRYSESLGYGWISDGGRTAEAIPLTPYLEVRRCSA
jgi:hypothetical protein